MISYDGESQMQTAQCSDYNPEWVINIIYLVNTLVIEKNQDLNGHPLLCMFLPMTLGNVQFPQHHTACQ
jgi:hypothetical protein